MKITVCARCGSQDLERLAWVTHPTNQYVDDHIFDGNEQYYCNKCGDRCDVVELDYSEKHGCAYRLEEPSVEGELPALIHYPMFTDGSVQAEGGKLDGGEIDYGHCIAEEGRAYYEEIMMLFPTRQGTITKLFWPHLDVENFVRERVEVCIDIVFREAHEKFKTKDGHIFPEQEMRLGKLRHDLVDLITEQVKQNL